MREGFTNDHKPQIAYCILLFFFKSSCSFAKLVLWKLSVKCLNIPMGYRVGKNVRATGSVEDVARENKNAQHFAVLSVKRALF